MADERNLNEINEDLINNSNDLLDIHNALNDVIKEEASNEESIKNTIDDINVVLDSIIEKKADINDINTDIINSERDISNNVSNQNDTLTNIVDTRRDELSNVQQTVLEQQKLYGFTSQVLTNLQTALTTQQQLNAAIAAGANIPTPSGGTPPAPPTSGGTPPAPPTSGGTPPAPPTSGSSSNNNTASSKWYSKGNLAKSTFQGAVNLVKKYGKEAADKWREIDRHVYTTGRQMGMTTTQMRGLQKNILENYGEMANRLGMTFEEIFKFQESYTQSVGRSVILTNKQVESFAGLSKIMGETAVNDMAKNMDDFGASSQTAIDYLTLGMARAANQGLNIKSTSESFAKNIKMASRFTFSKGVDGISKMTLLSQRLKFNMESIGGAIDKFSTIEGAITSSANLQVLGGAYAANYSNPLQAMGEALLDAEGFTNRIVDTVSKTAFFNKDTGMVEMSPIEKAKMREASKTLGIDYNELWNMASQQAKMRDIDKYVSGKGFTEEQKTFLANTAQYDAKTGAWTVTKMDKDGKQSQPINISNITSEELTEIQQQNDVEKSIQGDVHSIRNKLEEYLGKTVNDTKTFDEILTGQKERLTISISNVIDPAMNGIKNILRGMSMAEFALVSITKDILLFLAGNAIGSIGNGLGNLFNKKSKPSSRGGGSSIFKRGIGRGIKRGAIKMFGKGGAKALSKIIPGIGTVATIGYGAYEGYNAISKHSKNVERIESDNTMSQEEKNKAIHESKKERNENVGGAIGGASGALGGAALGASIGSVVPVVGTAIGGLIGGLAGWWLGDKAGRAVGNVVTNDYSSTRTVNNKTNNNAKSQISNENNSLSSNTNNALSQVSTNNNVEHNNNNNNLNDSIVKANDNKLLSMIQEDVRKIRLNTNPSENTFVYSNSIIPKNQYETKTYIKEITPSQQFNQVVTRPKVEKIDLNISGTLKVQGVGKTQNIDINEIFQSQEFQRMLINKINEGFSRNGNVVQTRSLDSTQAIMGGYYTPNQLNSKN